MPKASTNVSPQTPQNEANNNASYYLPPYSVCPFWFNSYIYQGTPKGIYYEYDAGTPPTNVTFEYCFSAYGLPYEYYHSTVFYDWLNPGVFTFYYEQIENDGDAATVGI